MSRNHVQEERVSIRYTGHRVYPVPEGSLQQTHCLGSVCRGFTHMDTVSGSASHSVHQDHCAEETHCLPPRKQNPSGGKRRKGAKKPAWVLPFCSERQNAAFPQEGQLKGLCKVDTSLIPTLHGGKGPSLLSSSFCQEQVITLESHSEQGGKIKLVTSNSPHLYRPPCSS